MSIKLFKKFFVRKILQNHQLEGHETLQNTPYNPVIQLTILIHHSKCPNLKGFYVYPTALFQFCFQVL